MELVDGAGNESGAVDNRAEPEPNRSGINLTENVIGGQESPISGNHWRTREVLLLAPSLVTISQHNVMTTESMWESTCVVMEKQYVI